MLGINYLFINNNLIIFFFIDNIVCLVLKEKIKVIDIFKEKLIQIYDIRILGELRWFLRV